jgi:hypothetical protein
MARVHNYHDTVDVIRFNEQCRQMWHTSARLANQYNKEALVLAKKLRYQRGQAEAYCCLGVFLNNQQQYSYFAHSYLQYVLFSFWEMHDKAGIANRREVLNANMFSNLSQVHRTVDAWLVEFNIEWSHQA